MVACLFFLLLQILLKGLDLWGGTSRSGRLRQAPTERITAGGGGQAGQALHGASLTGLLVDRAASRVDRTLLDPLQHRPRGLGKERSPQHQGDGWCPRAVQRDQLASHELLLLRLSESQVLCRLQAEAPRNQLSQSISKYSLPVRLRQGFTEHTETFARSLLRGHICRLAPSIVHPSKYTSHVHICAGM